MTENEARPAISRADALERGMRRIAANVGLALLAACGGPLGGDPDGFSLVYDPRVDSADATEDYARQIGADGFAADASRAASLANELVR